MFTRNAELARACSSLITATRQPVSGTVITGLHGLPIRIHCQVRKMRPQKNASAPVATEHAPVPEVFAYATIVSLGQLATKIGQAQHYAQDFASSDFHGTKAVLMAGSRAEVLRRANDDPMLRDSDVIPVKEIRIVGSSETGRSLKCEVTKFCSPDELEYCAAVVAAAQRLVMETERGDAKPVAAQKEFDDTVEGFYAFFNEQHQAAQQAASDALAASAVRSSTVAMTPPDAGDNDDDGGEDDVEAVPANATDVVALQAVPSVPGDGQA